MCVEQRLELVGGGDFGFDVIVTSPAESLQLTSGLVQRAQPAHSVAVGAQEICEAVAVTGVGLGAPRTPTWPGSVKRVRMHRDNQMPGLQESLDDPTAADCGRRSRISLAWSPSGNETDFNAVRLIGHAQPRRPRQGAHFLFTEIAR